MTRKHVFGTARAFPRKRSLTTRQATPVPQSAPLLTADPQTIGCQHQHAGRHEQVGHVGRRWLITLVAALGSLASASAQVQVQGQSQSQSQSQPDSLAEPAPVKTSSTPARMPLGQYEASGHHTPALNSGQLPGGWQWGMVLDVAATSRAPALGAREQGLALGHSDLSLNGPLTRHLDAQLTVAAHHHDGSIEAELEELWAQTRTLPAGLDLRAGRFASQLGYLNEQHPHADDFVERPLLYRAFLGGHWFDDGARLNWTAPTALYLRLGAEVFRGRQLVQAATPDTRHRNPAAMVLSARIGGDLNDAHSWQAGISWLKNRRDAAGEADHDHDHGHDHDHHHEGHTHAHGAAFSGRTLWLADLTWKWAPDGNNRERQLRLSWEHARISELGPHARRNQHHSAHYLSIVWRFSPSWESGVRFDRLSVQMPHGDHFHAGQLRERSIMLAWKPSHLQSLRLQYAHQHGARGIRPVQRSVQLQYVISLGAHAAHAF
ncbi:MAG: hypothetical protein Q4D91_01130 [Lautropia sp.]|nr:hypothetical protein [Lautropia sp.]